MPPPSRANRSSRPEPLPFARRVWARLRPWLEPPRRLKVTRTGRNYLLVTVGVGLGALNTGNNLLYLVLGVLLSVIVASGLISERLLRGVHVRRLGTEAAFAGEPFAYRWAVSSGSAAAFAVTLRELDSGLAGEGRAAYVPRGEERVVRADLLAPRRGPLALGAIEISTTFPLGLFAKSRRVEFPEELLVFPARRRGAGAEATGAPALQQGVRQASLRERGEGDLADLVELREGEDARRIHWRKSAALGRLVRALRDEETSHTYLLRVSPSGDRDRDDATCERAAAQVRQLLGAGHSVGLEAGVHRIRPAAGGLQERRLLTALGRLGFDAAAPPEES